MRPLRQIPSVCRCRRKRRKEKKNSCRSWISISLARCAHFLFFTARHPMCAAPKAKTKVATQPNTYSATKHSQNCFRKMSKNYLFIYYYLYQSIAHPFVVVAYRTANSTRGVSINWIKTVNSLYLSVSVSLSLSLWLSLRTAMQMQMWETATGN